MSLGFASTVLPCWIAASNFSVMRTGATSWTVFAASEAGTLLHYDGHRWRTQASGTKDALATLWGSGPGNVFALGLRGTILHYRGSDRARRHQSP